MATRDHNRELEARRLRKFHEAVGRARQQKAPESASEIAIHYDQAGLAKEAYDHALRAADRARLEFAHDDAAALLNIAERNAAGPKELAEVRLRRIQLLEATGKFEDARDLCDLAVGECGKQVPTLPTLPLRRARERMRDLLGEPANTTLASCSTLLEEATKTGDAMERVSLLIMISQSHFRLGDLAASQRAAQEAVDLAESLRDDGLLAGALNRRGHTYRSSDPARALADWRRALELFGKAGDHRGAAGVHNNLGIYYTDRCEFDKARAAFDAATKSARSAGNRADLGAVMMNLGAADLKARDFDRAHQLLGESLAIFASLKKSVWQLYALYNLANLELERGDHAAAADLYDFAATLAGRIGQSDVQIGATAGAGLAMLRGGRKDEARNASAAALQQLQSRTDWFSGRELAEALRIRLAALDGKKDDALDRYETAVSLAESCDFYCAAWLAAECADTIFEFDRERVRSSVNRFADKAKGYGLNELGQRCQAVLQRQ